MEEHYFFLNPLFWATSVSFVSLSLVVLLYRHRSQFTSENLPPGNVGYPVIGESFKFLASGWKGQPEKFFFDRITKFSSQVFKTSLFGEQAAIFCGAACNKFLFSNENKLVAVWYPSSIQMVFPSSTETSKKKFRKLIPKFMKPEVLQRYIGIMDTSARTHFADAWENKNQVQAFPLTNDYTFGLAVRLFLSLENPKEMEEIGHSIHLLNAGIISMPIDFPGTPFHTAIKSSKFIRDKLHKIIKQRKIDLAEGKASPTQDILSHMLLTCDEHGTSATELEIADWINGLLIAGHETTSATCAFIVKYLAELPHVYDAVYNEQMEIANSKSPGKLLNWDDLKKMKYSWNVASEVLRMSSPVQGGWREPLTDFMFHGLYIPKGWKLYWSATSTHKNEAYFPEPEKFDPSRFEGSGPAPYTYVPFGGGVRMCPGKEYARLAILVFMHNLVKRFKFEKVVADETIVVNPLPVPAEGLPIRLYPHTQKEVST
ncbi:hypothetical protein ACFX2C_025263 [Malus domestica]